MLGANRLVALPLGLGRGGPGGARDRGWEGAQEDAPRNRPPGAQTRAHGGFPQTLGTIQMSMGLVSSGIPSALWNNGMGQRMRELTTQLVALPSYAAMRSILGWLTPT